MFVALPEEDGPAYPSSRLTMPHNIHQANSTPLQATTSYRRRSFAVMLTGLAVVAVAACGHSTSPDDEFGTYALVSMNGQPLPVTQVDTQDRVPFTFTLNSEVLELRSNATWTIRVTFSYSSPFSSLMTVSDTTAGTWTRSGNSFTLNSPDDPPLTGILSGREMTFADASVSPPMTLVFRK
jgi:hypothetical protein